jgi:CRP-like cAMP-binding protein
MQQLIVLLNSIAPLSPALEAYLRSILQLKNFKKGATILKEGQTCEYIYFIESGLVRIYHWLEKGEVTTWLLKEGDVFISVRSFFRQQPSRDSIQALENCIIWGITYDQLQEICRLFPEFCWHRIFLTEEYYVRSEDKHGDRLMLSGAEKYALLTEHDPQMFTRVPLKYIYSYLGVSKPTFDRIRNKYAASKKKKGK